MLRDVLLRMNAADRRRLMRMGLASLQRQPMFDLLVRIPMPEGARLLRVIGGAGYDVARRDAQMHGVVEQVALEAS